MFNKANDYRKITFITYPGGNVLHPVKSAYDFDNGAKEEEKYNKDSEKFKLISLKAQSDITENETLTDDTLKITIEIDKHSYTYISASGFINIAYAKVLAQMTEDQLAKLQDLFLNREAVECPRMIEFQKMIVSVCKETGVLDDAYIAHIYIHDSYTEEHKNAIKYIVGHMCEYEDKGKELVVKSEDLELLNAIIDLGMSTYFHIEIEE